MNQNNEANLEYIKSLFFSVVSADQMEQIIEKQRDKALAGDTEAARLLIEYTFKIAEMDVPEFE